MNVTIKDIASYTGLSISTVSIVLNGKASKNRISEETAIRVREAKEKLQYKPNLLASSLRRGFTNIIGMVISDISNPFFMKVARVIEQEVAGYGYRGMVVGSDENDEKCIQMIDSFLNFKVDGMILAVSEGVKEKIKHLIEQQIPFVLLDRYFKKVSANMVVMDNYRSSYEAVDHLIKRGHRKIATFRYETNMQHMLDRFDGYKAALKDNGIRYSKRLTPLIPFSGIDKTVVKENIKYLIETIQADAIFFQTNQTAIPGMQAIFDLGYDIPGQVSVVCFHDNEFFSLLKPSITVLCQPIEEMGKECAHILLQNMREEVQKSVKQVYLTSKLIVRESS